MGDEIYRTVTIYAIGENGIPKRLKGKHKIRLLSRNEAEIIKNGIKVQNIDNRWYVEVN